MKIIAKTLLCCAAAAAVAGISFAQDNEGRHYEVSFSNELSTDCVTSVKAKDDADYEKDTGSAFAGFVEKAEAEFKSEKLDLGGSIEYTFSPVKGPEAILKDEDVDGYNFELSDYSYYIEFRPVQRVTLGWHDDVRTPGAYLPVWDDDLTLGNMTTEDGLAIIVRPVDGMRLCFGMDQSKFGLKDDDDDDNGDETKAKPIINFGADYNYNNLVHAGFAVKNVAASSAYNEDEEAWEERQLGIGVFAKVTPVEGLELYLGYSHNDYDGIGFGLVDPLERFTLQGQNVATLGATYEAGNLSLGFDAAFNFNGADDNDDDGLAQFAESDGNRYDTYFGLNVGYQIMDNLSAGITVLCAIDRDSNDDLFDDKADAYFAFAPEVAYSINANNEFTVGFNYEMAGSDYSAFSIPVKWTYSF